MEREEARGRSRASSTSSYGREVRCGCQYFQSDSLLPERRAMMMRPSSRNTNPGSSCDHEYEPVGTATLPRMSQAPVVRIIDTDVMPVADSDDSIDVKGRFSPVPKLDGDDVVVPLDGQIEDRAMEARELGSGDTSDDLELETAQQIQDRIEERFLSVTAVADEEIREEVNTSQVDSTAVEEAPSSRGSGGGGGLPQRIRNQAGKLRSRLKGIQRPNFTFPIERKKSTKMSRDSSDKAKSSEKAKLSDRSKSSDRTKESDRSKSSDKSKSTKPSRIDRIRASLPDRPRFSFPDKSKFHLPDKSKFHLPEINLPQMPKLPSKGSFHLPGRKRAPSLSETQRQLSTESTAGSKRNIFDFSTVPRLFDKKSKEYATSSPKDSRAQSSESATLPRTKKSFGSRWTSKLTDMISGEEDKPWRHPTSEEPRLSLRPQESAEGSEPPAWINEPRKSIQDEEILYADDDEVDVVVREEPKIPKLSEIIQHTSEESYEPEQPQIDPRLYDDQDSRHVREEERDSYHVSFGAVDPRTLMDKRIPSEDVPSEEGKYSENEPEVEEEEEEEEEENYTSEPEDESARSDRENQPSSGSSFERRRRGVIEEIDSDEIFVRVKGISQDDMTVAKYLTSEIRDALRPPGNALADEVIILDEPPQPPPRRPARKRTFRKRKDESFDSSNGKPKRILRRSEDSEYGSHILDDDSLGSRHRIVYHAESAPMDLSFAEPLDDIIVVKPIRRKSRSSLRSSSQVPSEEPIQEVSPEMSPPPVPQRRKRRVKDIKPDFPAINGVESFNGHDTIPASWKLHELTRRQSEPPIKPVRIPSRETVDVVITKQIEDDYIEPGTESDLEFEIELERKLEELPPLPPKRRSRSRGTSIFQDDDRISRGAESLDVAYIDDEEEDYQIPKEDLDYQLRREDTESRSDVPGYAVIEKKEKPPRPPPPRKRREKFATTPRPSPPKRPGRGYSTLRPTSAEDRQTPYEEIEGDDVNGIDEMDPEHRDLMSSQVLMKMAERPLPAPPRPPRRGRERREEPEELPTYASSTQQTDPLPDDVVIEEEVVQARVVITPSQSGSQIRVSTERIPSPNPFEIGIQAISHEELLSLEREILKTTTRSEPELARLRIEETPERDHVPPITTTRVEETPEKDRIPLIPPLPESHQTHTEEPPQRPPRTRSQSLSVQQESEHKTTIEELEERLTALLTSETFKIASLEVSDLKVDKLSVAELEAHKIAVSELDAIVISATEISSANDEEQSINPSLLRELIAIRSQLESVTTPQPQESHYKISEGTQSDVSGEISVVPVEHSALSSPKLDQLHLEPLEKSSETRAIYSSQGIEKMPVREPIREHQEHPREHQESIKELSPISSRSSSRASSPSRILPSGAVLSKETASPIKSLPPAISVTPDTVESSEKHSTPHKASVPQKTSETSSVKPQRATISYSSESSPESIEAGRTSPIPPQFIAFQTSQIPAQFFNLASPTPTTNSSNDEPGVIDMTQQLLRALRTAGKRAMRHFVGYVVSRVNQEESEAKIREVELTLCALLLIIAGLLIVCFAGPRNITHHHHWDYFNPPRL